MILLPMGFSLSPSQIKKILTQKYTPKAGLLSPLRESIFQ